jgi:hypothetical protein
MLKVVALALVLLIVLLLLNYVTCSEGYSTRLRPISGPMIWKDFSHRGYDSRIPQEQYNENGKIISTSEGFTTTKKPVKPIKNDWYIDGADYMGISHHMSGTACRDVEQAKCIKKSEEQVKNSECHCAAPLEQGSYVNDMYGFEV